MFPYNDPSMLNQDEPLSTRLMDSVPGMFTMAGFYINRGANTIMRGGGYLDDTLKFDEDGNVTSRKRKQRKLARQRTIQGGRITDANRSQYLGGRRGIFGQSRAERLMAKGQVGTAQGRIGNSTPRPRNFTRLSSLTALTDQSYTPFQGAKFVGKTKTAREFFAKRGITAGADESLMGAGFFSYLTAGVKTDRIERKAERKALASKAAGGDTSLSKRTAKKLSNVDKSITSLSAINNPSFSPIGRTIDTTRASGIKIGERGNLLASSMGGGGSRYMAGYARGALGFSKAGGLTGEALKGANMARVHMAQALRGAGVVTKGSGMRLAGEALEKGVFKTLGTTATLKTFATASGAKVLGARAAALAIPGLNVVAAASLVYDLGKMAGQVVKSGINLSRDAVSSIKGSINKPLFGMGYKDTEAAATSRARGVMAIQNSRLNARSALGSEASMMAAHYG